MHHSKVRGQERKFRILLREMGKFEPFRKTDIECEHFHVPCGEWLSAPKTSGRIKTEFCRKWLKKAEEFIAKKPENLPFCKIAAVICLPEMSASQLMVFYDREYCENFCSRDSEYQKWTCIEGKSLVKERNIKTSLIEKGCIEELCDDDFSVKSQIWYYGEN